MVNIHDEARNLIEEYISMLREENKKHPDRDISLAITHAEDSLMRLNRSYFIRGQLSKG